MRDIPNHHEPIHETIETAAVATILRNLERSGLDPESTQEAASKRKEQLERVAHQLPAIGNRLLTLFSKLAKKEELDPGKLGFYVVGGRVRATPIKETTDFDIVISAERPLDPFAKQETITLKQRQEIAFALYAAVPDVFNDLGIGDDYEKGLIEIKVFGDKTPTKVEGEDDVLKITELETDHTI